MLHTPKMKDQLFLHTAKKGASSGVQRASRQRRGTCRRPPKGRLGPFWSVLESSWGDLGPVGLVGPSWDLSTFWGALEAPRGRLGSVFGRLGASWGRLGSVLGPSSGRGPAAGAALLFNFFVFRPLPLGLAATPHPPALGENFPHSPGNFIFHWKSTDNTPWRRLRRRPRGASRPGEVVFSADFR